MFVESPDVDERLGNYSLFAGPPPDSVYNVSLEDSHVICLHIGYCCFATIEKLSQCEGDYCKARNFYYLAL